MTHGKMGRRVAFAAALVVVLGGAATWVATASSGTILRTTPLAVAGSAGPVMVDEANAHVLVLGAGRHGVLSILDARSGLLLHTVGLRGYFMGSAALAARSGPLFVLHSIAAYNVAGHTVSMLDARTGALLRTITVPVGPSALAVDDRGGHVFVTSTGALNATAGVDQVSMLDARSGAVLRVVPLRLPPSWVQMAVDGRTGRVFVLSYAGNAVGVLDARTGRVTRTVAVGVHPTCIAVDEASGHVFVGNDQSISLSMLDARSGTVVRTIGIGFPLALAVDGRAGHVIVAHDQAVSILDARTGTILHTLTVGGDPSGVAVDERSGRAFVTATGNHVSILIHWLGHGQLSWLGEWNDEYTTVLDTRTGALLRTIHAGAHTRDVVVDEQTGRAFVPNYQSNSVSMLDAAS